MQYLPARRASGITSFRVPIVCSTAVTSKRHRMRETRRTLFAAEMASGLLRSSAVFVELNVARERKLSCELPRTQRAAKSISLVLLSVTFFGQENLDLFSRRLLLKLFVVLTQMRLQLLRTLKLLSALEARPKAFVF